MSDEQPKKVPDHRWPGRVIVPMVPWDIDKLLARLDMAVMQDDLRDSELARQAAAALREALVAQPEIELEENPFTGHARKVAYSLRLDATDVERLEAAAARRGVRPTQLAREWLVERLDSAVAGSATPTGDDDDSD